MLLCYLYATNRDIPRAGVSNSIVANLPPCKRRRANTRIVPQEVSRELALLVLIMKVGSRRLPSLLARSRC